MKLIKEKKINNYLMIFFLYVSFCACNYFAARGTLSYTSMTMAGAGVVGFMFNDIVAVLIGGLIPTLLFELVTSFVFKFSQVKLGGAADDMRYALRFFYIPANLICFGIKFVYLLSPIVSIFGNVMIDFVITAIFCVGFLVYCAKNCIKNDRWGAMIYQLGGAYLIVYGIMTVAAIVMGVIL